MHKEIILIFPYSVKLRNGKENPKNYPYWKELIDLIKLNYDYLIIQIGKDTENKIEGVDAFLKNLSFKELEKLLNECKTWISIDSFFPHFVNCYNKNKSGIVLFGPSDPKIYGYTYNVNILKDTKYLRKNMYEVWENTEYNKESFYTEQQLFNFIKHIL